jgi:PAS domain-containing protein
VEIVRNDEIGRISNVFNRLADNLLDMVKHLESIVEMRTMELNKANEILQENQSQLHLILDTAAEAIFGTDLNGRCTFGNKSCLHLLGYTDSEELLGIDMWSALGCKGRA